MDMLFHYSNEKVKVLNEPGISSSPHWLKLRQSWRRNTSNGCDLTSETLTTQGKV